jgi:Leucine Rich repeat
MLGSWCGENTFGLEDIAVANVTSICRRLFRFRLLTLLVLVSIYALWLGFVSHKAGLQRDAVSALRNRGFGVAYDYQMPSLWNPQIQATPFGPKWLHDVIGDDYFQSVAFVTSGNPVTKEDMTHIAAFPELERLILWDCPTITGEDLQGFPHFSKLVTLALSNSSLTDNDLAQLPKLDTIMSLKIEGAQITDEGLKHLSRFTSLTGLELQGNNVTGAGLVDLRKLDQLGYLSLNGCPITDSGLSHIAEIPSIRHLDVGHTRITDAGMVYLSSLTNLQNLELNSTAVSDESIQYLVEAKGLLTLDVCDTRITAKGLAKLQEALPNCKIEQ